MKELDIYDFSDLSMQEKKFRRSVEWGAAAISFMLSALAIYLFDGVEVFIKLIQ